MTRQLAGRRILVADGSTGLAEQLANHGSRVAMAISSPEKQPANLFAKPILTVTADIRSDEDRRRLMDRVVAEFGGLDVLINNADDPRQGGFVTSSEDNLREVMEANFFAPVELIRLALPILAKGDQPAIVNVGSMCGRRGLPGWSDYSASKFALTGFTETLRGELARFDIDILLVQPGLHAIDLSRHIIRTLQRNRSEIVLGREARWCLRLQRWFPRWLDRRMARRAQQQSLLPSN